MAQLEQGIASRHLACRELLDALEAARVSPILHRMPGSDRSTITAHINYGYGGLRRIQVVVDDAGYCTVYLSPLFDVLAEHPEAAEPHELERAFILRLSVTTPALAAAVVRRVRWAAFHAGE